MTTIEQLRSYKPDNLFIEGMPATNGTRRPIIDVGEYLPAVDDNVLEFARIHLSSMMGDVFSCRIQYDNDRYHITIVDEYSTEFYLDQDEFDAIPTQGEVIDAITSMDNLLEGQPYILAIIENNTFTCIEEIVDFIRFDSNLYPNLNELFIPYLLANGFTYSDTEQKKITETIALLEKHKPSTEWDSIVGTICFNIWNETISSPIQELQDINPSFLCALNLFQHWDSVYLSKQFSMEALSEDASSFVSNRADELIADIDRIKENTYTLGLHNSTLSSINFITIFSQRLNQALECNDNNINPMYYFQRGVEILFLFLIQLKSRDIDFYHKLLIVGDAEQNVANIIKNINDLEPGV